MVKESVEKFTWLFNEKALIVLLFGMMLSFSGTGDAAVDLPYNPNLDEIAGGVHEDLLATALHNA
jgi:hypothetical protein